MQHFGLKMDAFVQIGAHGQMNCQELKVQMEAYTIDAVTQCYWILKEEMSRHCRDLLEPLSRNTSRMQQDLVRMRLELRDLKQASTREDMGRELANTVSQDMEAFMNSNFERCTQGLHLKYEKLEQQCKANQKELDNLQEEVLSMTTTLREMHGVTAACRSESMSHLQEELSPSTKTPSSESSKSEEVLDNLRAMETRVKNMEEEIPPNLKGWIQNLERMVADCIRKCAKDTLQLRIKKCGETIDTILDNNEGTQAQLDKLEEQVKVSLRRIELKFGLQGESIGKLWQSEYGESESEEDPCHQVVGVIGTADVEQRCDGTEVDVAPSAALCHCTLNGIEQRSLSWAGGRRMAGVKASKRLQAHMFNR
eukprot:s1777_g5.t1